ncbi:MAG: hypothetical protein ACRDWS_02325 [Acidimicrobiia bacterium]
MLGELSVAEQRFLAVREVLDGAKITYVAVRYGVDRRTALERGRVVEQGTGALTAPQHPYTRLLVDSLLTID